MFAERKQLPVYERGRFTAHRVANVPGYVIRENGISIYLKENPRTYIEMRTMINKLASCTVCHGSGQVVCRHCAGMIYAVNGTQCPNCENGVVDCPRCDGSGNEPHK